MNTPASPLSILTPDTEVFLQRHVSMNLATTDAANRPAVTRVFGCRIAEDRCTITLFISAAHNRQVLENIRANRAIAVVFSRPSTHQTIQLKGTDARLVSLGPDDLSLLRAYRDSMIEELGSIGFPPAFVHSMIPPPEAMDTGIRFTPLAAFSQTPGPQAGRRLSV